MTCALQTLPFAHFLGVGASCRLVAAALGLDMMMQVSAAAAAARVHGRACIHACSPRRLASQSKRSAPAQRHASQPVPGGGPPCMANLCAGRISQSQSKARPPGWAITRLPLLLLATKPSIASELEPVFHMLVCVHYASLDGSAGAGSVPSGRPGLGHGAACPRCPQLLGE